MTAGAAGPVDLVAVDVGGTHTRFARARIADGRIISLDDPVVLKTAAYARFEHAWQTFASQIAGAVPRAAAIALAAPVEADVIKLTNNPWVFRPATLAGSIGVDRLTLVNDFGAVGHAVANAPADMLAPLCGPDEPLPDTGLIAVVGPGTGLGVAHVLRRRGLAFVTETEGGHLDFAPRDAIDDAILAHLRARHGRVSVERVVSGPALATIRDVLAAREGRQVAAVGDDALWAAALDGSDDLAVAAFERFTLSLGAVAGDIALAQGAHAVVIAGGLGLRIADGLSRALFEEGFTAKGRFRQRMAALPVRLLMHPQPGLFGAAAAFAEDAGRDRSHSCPSSD